MKIIHWFRRDLRLTDNPALHWAAKNASELLLVYIDAPEEEAPWQPGGASRWWLHQSLTALSADLKSRGQQLQIFQGPSLETLQRLIAHSGADAVSWNRLYEPAIIARDKTIKASLKEQGLTVHSANSQLLLEPWDILNGSGKPYRVFTPYWKAARQQLNPHPIQAPPDFPGPLQCPKGVELDTLAIQHPWAHKLSAHWTPGEAAALEQLEHFSETGLSTYDTDRDRPDRRGTSRLSPHLHFGELGPRQALAQSADADISGRFGSELGWREFAHHILFHFPETIAAPLNPKFEEFPWRDATDGADDLAAWQKGQTGIDLVDAGMRELWETGFMHNRVRMVVASLLTKNLGIHWLQGARWFWDTLVDANLASNTLGWQWVAGCGADAAPYFRIFNPDSQAEKFDPNRDYRQRWLTRPRPKPIVDLASSRKEALARNKRDI